MFEESQNKIYYKGNPYTRQNYIPTSALKNRTKPTYLVELPQGQDYFGASRKKQYVSAHHQSEIKQTGLFQQNLPTYHHGTYQISDIEGAGSSSLLSQAVRNRMKAHSRHFHTAIKPHAHYNHSAMFHTLEQQEEERHRTQIKIPQSSVNYHYSRKKHIQTEPTYILPSPTNQDRDLGHNPERREHKYTTEETQTQGGKINELEQQLFQFQEARLKDKVKGKEQPEKNASLREDVQRVQSQSEKQMEVRRLNNAESQQKRTSEEIKSMWHGDNHKILLFPSREIRKLNPTYLSTETYNGTGKVYNKYNLPF